VPKASEASDSDDRYAPGRGYTWYEKTPESAGEALKGDLDETVKWIAENPPTPEAAEKPRVALDGYVWRVLDVRGKKALLVTEQVIGCGPIDTFEHSDAAFNWAGCLLDQELNSEQWLNTHLPQLVESGRISATAPRGYGSGEQLGKVFLLSKNDLNNKKFFPDRDSRCATSLGGAGAQWRWLRSPGRGAGSAAVVYGDGSVYTGCVSTYGNAVLNDSGGVRPAFWLNL
jgi:hypothetical protein